MSIASDILKELWNSSLYYKGFRVNIFGIPIFKDANTLSIKSSLSRLKRKHYIGNDSKGWYITDEGRKYVELRLSFENFESPFSDRSPKNLLLMFDVPVEKNAHRNWLRKQLKEFGYVMVQQSVWVGPSPLPKEFLSYMKSVGLKDRVKTFKLAKPYKEPK